MRPRTMLLLLLSLVLLVPLVAAYGLWSIDSSYLRRLIVSRVEQATGRSFTVDGPVTVSWSLHPTLSLSQLSLANTPGTAEPKMLTVERLVLQVGALSLLSGRPDLERLSLTGLDLLLESGADGTDNWAFRSQPAAELVAAPDAAPAGTDSVPIVRQVLVADARVRYRDGAGASTELKLDRAVLDASAAGAAATFGLAGSLDGRPLRASGRLDSIDALLAADGAPLTVTDFSTNFGDSDLAGSGSLQMDGGRPRLEADLTATRLDLRGLGAAPAADPLLAGRPLPFDVLRRFDLQLRLRAASVRTTSVELARVELAAALEAGRLKVQPLEFGLQDRPVAGALVVDAADEPGRVELMLGGDDLDIGRLLASLAQDSAVEGRGDLRMQVTGRGDTVQALAASTTGRATVLMGAGMLPTDLLSRLAGGLHQLLADAAEPGKARPFNCAVLDARAENGLVRLDLLADGPYSTIVGDGTVDLHHQTVDLTLTPQAHQLDLNVAVPVNVRGPLASPDVALAEGEAVRRVASLLGAIVFPPAALGAFVDLGSAKDNACLEIAAHPERLAAPAATGSGSDIVDRIEGAGRKLLDEIRPTP